MAEARGREHSPDSLQRRSDVATRPVNHASVDMSRPLAEQPEIGHNRWHPGIEPILRVDPGAPVVLETLDAMDLQLTQDSTSEDVASSNLNRVHPLTGPLYINGAEPGDLLEVHIDKIEPASFGFTAQIPGFGLLRDLFPDPFLVRWGIAEGFAQSPDLPGVRIREQSFMGTLGVAPSPDLLKTIAERERALLDRGGAVHPPESNDAIPTNPAIASEGLRTTPPRETGGNLDVKHLGQGTTVLIPVSVPGALFSCGDAHFAQGDGEVCGTAIEMQAVLHCHFGLRKGESARRSLNSVSYFLKDPSSPRDPARHRGFFATTGICVDDQGTNYSEDATLAAKGALRNMIEHLVHSKGYSAQQAYAICSVAVNMQMSELVDVPNFVVSALLPDDIFVE